jgi:hypothetical protein
MVASRQELTFAECRSLGHEWRKGKPVGVDDQLDNLKRPYAFSTGSIGIPSYCGNCGTTKVRWITRSGESQTRYDYPDGYSRHGDDVMTAQQWRHSYVETIFQQFERSTRKAKAS